MIPPPPVRKHRPAHWIRHFQRGRRGQPVPRPEPTAGGLAHFAWRWNRFTVLLFRSSLIITLVAGLIKIVLGTIALSPFVELGVNIQQAVAKRRHPSPLVHAAKLTALASSIIGLSLVQVALLSMAEPKADHSRYNAWGGIFCGAIAITIGVGMIIRSSHHLRRLAVV